MISKILSMAPEHALGVLTCRQIPRFSLISRLASDCVNLIFPTAPERSRSPPSQIWLNVTCRLGAERGFLAELRREQEPSGSVCLSVCLSAAAVSVCLGHTHTQKPSSCRLPRSGHDISDYGSIAVLLLFSPLRDVTPLDAPVPIEEGEAEGASLPFFDYQVK